MEQSESFPNNDKWEIVGIYNEGYYDAAAQECFDQDVNPVKPIPAKEPGVIRIVCISDTHSEMKRFPTNIPDGDILIHAGDFSYTGRVSEVVNFNSFLASLPHEHKIVIAGNHDITFEPEFYKSNWKNFHRQEPEKYEMAKSKLTHCTYLEDQSVTVNGLHIYGTPWQPEFGGWAFNLRRGKACAEKWQLIPEGVDILISHGPPVGHGDVTFTGLKVGCEDLMKEVKKKKPLVHVFGHVHEGYGVTREGNTVFINASTCNLKYKPFNLPIVVDIKNKVNGGNVNNNNTSQQQEQSTSEDGFVFE